MSIGPNQACNARALLGYVFKDCKDSVAHRCERRAPNTNPTQKPTQQIENCTAIEPDPPKPQARIWGFPKLGNPNIAPQIVRSSKKGPQNKVPLIFGDFKPL